MSNTQMVRLPCVKLINIDFCDSCVGELREVIRAFMEPISYIEVKRHDCTKKEQFKDCPNIEESEAFDSIPPDLV